MAKQTKDGLLEQLFPPLPPGAKHYSAEELRAWKRVRRFLRTCTPVGKEILFSALNLAARRTRSLDRRAYALLVERVRGLDRMQQMVDRAIEDQTQRGTRSGRRTPTTLRVIKGGKPTAR